MVNKFIISLILGISFYLQCFALTDVDRQEILNKNILAQFNPGFENGLSSWTASGTTPLRVTSGSNLLSGKGSVTWDSASAAETYSTKLVAIPKGLYGRAGVFQILTQVPSGAATHLVQVYDGTNILVSQAIVSSTTPSLQSVNFIFPSSGSIQGRLISVAANEPLVVLDDAYIGAASNVTNVSQSQFIGDAKILGTGSGTWDKTGISLGAFTTQAAFGGPTIIKNPGPGTIQTTDTDLPRFTINNLPPGTYKIHIDFYGYGSASGQVYSYAIYDGVTTGTPREFTSPAAGRGSFVALEDTFTYTTTANHTYEVYGATGSGTVSIQNEGTSNGGGDVYFSVVRFPSASELAYSPDTYNWYIDASIGNITNANYFDMGTANASSFYAPNLADLTMILNPGSMAAKISCSSTNLSTGLTCAAGNEEAGINFNLPGAGSVEFCASFDNYVDSTSGSINNLFAWQETAAGSQTPIQDCGPSFQSGIDSGTQGSHHPTHVCGICKFASSGNKTVRMMMKVHKTGTISVNTFHVISSTDIGQQYIHVYAHPLTQNIPTPLLVGSVSTPSSGAEKITRAEFGDAVYENVCAASPCTVHVNPGSWVTSVTRGGAGDYTLNFSSTTFNSTKPTCTCAAAGAATNGAADFCQITQKTTSSLRVLAYDAAGAGHDEYFNIICMGPK